MDRLWVVRRWHVGGTDAPPECLRPLVDDFSRSRRGYIPDFLGEAVLCHSPIGSLELEGRPIAAFHFAVRALWAGGIEIPGEAVRLYMRFFMRLDRGRNEGLNAKTIFSLLEKEPFRPSESQLTIEALRMLRAAPILSLGDDGDAELRQYRFGTGTFRRFPENKRDKWDWEIIKRENVAVKRHFATLEQEAQSPVGA